MVWFSCIRLFICLNSCMILMVGVSATHFKHSHVYFIRLILIMLWDKGEREKESRIVRWWTISIAGKCFKKCLGDEWPWSLLLYDYGTFLSSTNQSLIVIFHITVALYRTILIITNNNNNKGFSALFFYNSLTIFVSRLSPIHYFDGAHAYAL